MDKMSFYRKGHLQETGGIDDGVSYASGDSSVIKVKSKPKKFAMSTELKAYVDKKDIAPENLKPRELFTIRRKRQEK